MSIDITLCTINCITVQVTKELVYRNPDFMFCGLKYRVYGRDTKSNNSILWLMWQISFYKSADMLRIPFWVGISDTGHNF
jgi:hypothetical protein